MIALAAATTGGLFYYSRLTQPTVLTEASLTLAPVQKGTIRDLVSATGILQTRDLLLVGVEVPGTIQYLYAKVNDTVGEGTTLASLDDRKMRLKLDESHNGVATDKAALAQAQAVKLAAEIALRYQVDLEKKGGFRSERDQAEAQLKAADAGVLMALAKLDAVNTMQKEAKLALDMAQIKVPVSSSHGTKRDYLILERKVSLGQTVGPQAGPLFVLAGDLSQMEVHAQVAEGDITKVRKGLSAIFTITGFNEEEVEFRGIVREIRPLASNMKGAIFYDTIVEMENQKDPASGEWRLRPGMTASVDILRREHKDVWKVPSQALNFVLEEAYHTPAIKDRLAEWAKRPDAGLWATVWTWDEAKKSAWPMFVRILGNGSSGEPALKDSDGHEVLEWEPGREPSADRPPPHLILTAPPARSRSVFDRPANIKVS